MNEKKPGMLASKKKKPGMLRRGVQPGTIDKVAAQVAAAESAETHEYEVRHVPIANIHLWENQPRTFYLTMEDVCRGSVDSTDEFVEQKKDELEGIIGLAMSLKEFGMLNAPLAYALPGKRVQLLGGQRRTMASVFALFHICTTIGSDDVPRHDVEINAVPDRSLLVAERIAVKVFSRKPDEITVERIGMADNVQRTELPIADKLRWLIKYADKMEGRGREVEWRDLVDTLGLSRSQAYEWVKVVKARKDKWVHKVVEMVLLSETSLKRLTEIAAAEAAHRESIFRAWFEKRPTPDIKHRVSLGVSSNLHAIRNLVLENVEEAERKRFDQIDWSKPKEVKKAFTEFMKYWEEKHG
ncbi:MAG: hypothetical protein ABFS45_22765 [Pseudomonadota bacterium]